MKSILALVPLLASLPALAHVGHTHSTEHGLLHHLIGTEQLLLLLGVGLVAGLAYWLRPRW